MNIKQKIITAAAVVLLGLGAFLSIGYQKERPLPYKFSPQIISLKVEATSTAYAVLQQELVRLNLGFETKDYGDMGIVVEKIGDWPNGGLGGSYWMYYLNGQLAPVAANKQEVKAGDIVEWRFEKPNF